MKTTILQLAIAFLLLLQSCENNCPPDPLTENDIAGYIDGSTGILFTTSADRDDVLAQLDATPHDGSLYKLPIYEIDEEQVYLLFEIAEVEMPAIFIDYQFEDYCYEGILMDFEDELLEIIEDNDGNLSDQFIMACGDIIGEIGEKEKANDRLRKGIEQEDLEKLMKKVAKEQALKKKLSEISKKKGDEAKQALNNGDEDGAKEKAKELKEETKLKFTEYLDWNWCDDWKLGMKYPMYYTKKPTVIPPDLIKSFSKDNIRYKVYKSAKCGVSHTPPYFVCWKFQTLDTLRTTPPVWNTVKQLPRKNCERGTAFCVEQEVVVAFDMDYSDSLCERLITVRPVKGFACFD